MDEKDNELKEKLIEVHAKSASKFSVLVPHLFAVN